VTSFLYQAHPVSTVLGGVNAYTRDQAAAVLHYYRDFMPAAPDELTAYAGPISMSDGTPAVGVTACYCGDLTEGERIVKPLRAFGSPLFDAIQPMPFPIMQKLVDEMSPDGTNNYWRSTFIRDYGGATGRVGPANTAFAQRQAEYNVGIETQWTDAAESAKHICWTRTLSDAPKPYSSNGYRMNFLGDESRELVRAVSCYRSTASVWKTSC
jgi:hypothetical protein